MICGKLMSNLTACDHSRRRSPIHVGLIEYNIRAHVCWPGGQHLLLAVNQIAGVKRRQLKPVPVCDCVGGTSLYAIAAKNAAIIIDVINLGIAFRAAHAMLGSILGRFDVNAVRRAIGGAQEAGHAFFQSVFVALQNVSAAEAGLKARASERTLAVGIILDRGGPKHLREGDAHPLGDRGNVLQHRHTCLVYRKACRERS